MTLSEARLILGLGPEEDPRPFLREFRIVRERLAEKVRDAPDEIEADCHQRGLMDIDRALAAIHETLEEPGSPAPTAVLVPAPVAVVAAPPAPTRATPARRSRVGVIFLCLCLLLLAGAGAGWVYWQRLEQETRDRLARIELLEREALGHLENRRWPEAAAAYDEIARLAPDSPQVPLGYRSVEVGMAEEQQQFAGYWTGQARAALEAERWEEAEDATRQVLGKFPGDRESAALLSEIAAARKIAAHRTALTHAQDLMNRRQWEAASQAARAILATRPADPEALALQAEATAAMTKAAADVAQARSLFQQALARDHGQFDQQALDWLREANLLAPEDREIAAEFEKMAAYTRTLRVPQDFPTPVEALANARARDRIILAEGAWKGPLIVNVAIELQGAGPDKTRIECPAEAGCVITLGPAATGSRLTGLTFRHQSQTGEAERFSAGLVRGAAVQVLDCHFIDACGHGLAVIEGGAVTARRCRFAENGWDGAAAIGAGTAMDIRDSEASGNFEHGLESWDGAAMTAVNNRCEANSRNGIHADNGRSSVVIEDNRLLRNREFGLVLSGAAIGQVRNNTATGNLLGGMVVRAAVRIPVTGNPLRDNKGPGLTLERGLAPAAFSDNPLASNTGKQLLVDFNFQEPPPAPKATPVPAPALRRVDNSPVDKASR